jgi:hypothetical protein
MNLPQLESARLIPKKYFEKLIITASYKRWEHLDLERDDLEIYLPFFFHWFDTEL